MISFMKVLETNTKIFSFGEQANWNYALKYNRTISVTYLSIKMFPCGDEFYNRGKRIFYSDSYSILSILYLCTSYITVHNNWITGMDKKLYREKEMHLYLFDYNEYYTSRKRKYFMLFFNTSTIIEDEILLTFGFNFALSTNSIFILPKFKCNHCSHICRYCKMHGDCSYIELWKIRNLNNIYNNLYRESV